MVVNPIVVDNFVSLLNGKVVREQHYFSVRPSVHPSICPSRYLLLNHWVEFNQTCYITSPYGEHVRQQHYFSVQHPSICPSRYLLLKGKRKVQGVQQHKPPPVQTQGERKQTKSNKGESNKRTKSTKISSLFPKRGNRNAKRTEKHKNKITPGKT